MSASKRLHRLSGIRPLTSALFFALAIALWSTDSPPASGAEETRKILLFSSEDSHLPSIVALNQSVRGTLSRGLPGRIQFYSEHLDQFRLPEERYRQQLISFLRLKYAGQKFDLIVALGGPALRLTMDYGPTLFPDTPIVFFVLDSRELQGLTLPPNITGVTGNLEFRSTLDLALKLQPNIRRVVVVTGAGRFERDLEEIARGEFRDYESKVKFTYLTGLKMDDLRGEVAKLPERTIVFYITVSQDGKGDFYAVPEALSLVAQASSVPVYGVSGMWLGRGIVGGPLVNFEALGVRTAELGLRVLSGEKPASIQVETPPNIPTFDWRQLRRWGISEKQLPPGSLVRFAEPSLWDLYKWHIGGGVALILVQTLLIGGLLINRFWRRKAQQSLAERLRFESLLAELSAAFVSLPVDRVDREIEKWLRRLVEFLEVDHISLVECSPDGWRLGVSHSHTRPGVGPDPDSVLTAQPSWYAERLRSEKPLAFSRLPDDLPEQAKLERECCLRTGLKSNVIIPLPVGGARICALALSSFHSYRDWPDDLVARLQLIGEVLANALVRQQGEKALRESEKRFRLLADATPVLVWQSGVDKLYTYFNRHWLEFTGRTVEQELGHGWAEGVHPDDCARRSQLYDEAFDRRGPFEMEYRLRRADGEHRWILDCGAPLFTSEGAFVGYLGGCVDLTERKRDEEALHAALAELSELKNHLQAENVYLQEEIKLSHNFNEIVGNSDELKYVLYKVEQVAAADATVLILGETGTGKELIARAIHQASLRQNRTLVKVNCAVLPANLIESELFGHEKGAFTGASARHLGRFELANGGTLFLDEIGELPLELQPKLLRVLQEGEFERVGGSQTIKVDVRIIAATNRNLKAEVQTGRFREDLWYRLNVFPLTLPPLRGRKGDIPLLVNHYVNQFSKKLGKPIQSIAPATIKALQDHAWPGNVRELANVIERAVINLQGPVLHLADKLEPAPAGHQSADGGNGRKRLAEMEKEIIYQRLVESDWKIEGPGGAAKSLGLNPSTLRLRMNKLGIRRPET